MNIKKLFHFRRKKKEQENISTQEQVRDTFKTLEQLEQSNLLLYDRKNNRLFIEQPLAYAMMMTEDSWLHFMQNCFLWIIYREANEQWEMYIISEELKAVHKMRKRFPNLSANDIDRIKHARRAEICSRDMQPKTIDGFEFFVIRETTDNEDTPADSTVPGGEISLVGSYNADQDNWEMAPWQDVKDFLEK